MRMLTYQEEMAVVRIMRLVDKTLTSEDDDDNDEDENDDSLQQISNEKPMLGAKSSLELCNDSSVGNTTNYEDHAHLLDDEECTEIYASMPDQYFPSLTASNIFNSTSNVVTGLEVSEINPSMGLPMNRVSSKRWISDVIVKWYDIDHRQQHNEYQASSDAYSAQSILPKVISLLSQPCDDVTVFQRRTKIIGYVKHLLSSPLHELGNSDDQQELWAFHYPHPVPYRRFMLGRCAINFAAC